MFGEGRLTGSVAAQNANERTFLDSEIDIFERPMLIVVGEAHGIEFYGVCHEATSFWSWKGFPRLATFNLVFLRSNEIGNSFVDNDGQNTINDGLQKIKGNQDGDDHIYNSFQRYAQIKWRDNQVA